MKIYILLSKAIKISGKHEIVRCLSWDDVYNFVFVYNFIS